MGWRNRGRDEIKGSVVNNGRLFNVVKGETKRKTDRGRDLTDEVLPTLKPIQVIRTTDRGPLTSCV